MGDLHQLAKALHPTPAVCGVQDQATAFIRTKEQHNCTYAGFLGWSSPWAAPTANLRCARWADNGVVLFAGGGLWRVLSLRTNG